jgi:preprotein translocase subunit SecB
MTDQNTQNGVVFSLEKIYIKDSSYEAPNVPQFFVESVVPEVGVQVGISHRPLDPAQGVHEVVLAVTVTAKTGDKTVFLAEAHQAGLFRIQGLPDVELPKALEIACPNVLLPFVRQTVNDLIVNGGFPQLLISPINFESLYQQKLQVATAPAGSA